jgi:exoribonuclease II
MYPSRNGLPQRLLLATAPSRAGQHHHHAANTNRKNKKSTHTAASRVAYAPNTIPHPSNGYETHDRIGQTVYATEATAGNYQHAAAGHAQHHVHADGYQTHRTLRRPTENMVAGRGGESGVRAVSVSSSSASISSLAFAPPVALHLGPVALAGPFSSPHAAPFVPNQLFHHSSASTAAQLTLEQNLLSNDALRPGTVVEFHTDGTDHRLGLITKCVDDSGEVVWVSEPATHPTATGTHLSRLLPLKKFQLIFILSSSAPTQRMVSAKDVTFVWPRKHRNVVFEYTLDNLPALIRHANQLVQQNRSQIPVVWGSYVDTQRSSIQMSALAEFLFGSQPKPHELYVAHRLLQENKIYFKQSDRYSYSCRSLAEVQEEKRNLQQRQREEHQVAQFVQRLQRRLAEMSASSAVDQALPVSGVEASISSTAPIDWNPSRDHVFIDRLKSYALATPLQPAADSTWSSMLKPLALGRQPDKVFKMLVQLGIMHKYENPHLARFPRKLDFDTAELKQYAQMSALLDQSMPPSIPTPSMSLPRLPASVDRDSGHRRDLRSTGPAFAIDNASGSDEIDDAVGLEQRSDGSTWIHVHIGDPSRLVAPNDELDALARQRAQSVFLPERAVTMFPPSLARNQFSLLPGKLNFALSYSFRLGGDGEVAEFEITPSVIDQVHCLTYDQADELLKLDASMSATKRQHAEVLNKMVTLANNHRDKRLARGACVLDAPRAEMTVLNRGEEIDLKVVRDAASPSRNMVSEFMILVGELTAKFATRNNIPIPLRTQAARRAAVREQNPDLPALPEEWSNVLTQMDQMTRLCAAQTETEPRPHSGLAVDMYCQTTSPIRRYLDLLVHYQIKAALRGDSLPFDKRAVQRLIAQLESVSSELSRLTFSSQRYWMLRYLERQPQDRIYSALVTGADFSTDPPGSALLLTELGWRTNTILDRSPNRGEMLKLYISYIDAFGDVIRFREVMTAPDAVSDASL